MQNDSREHLQIKDLEIFEKEISKVLHEMMNSNGLENLRVQYEGLFKALKASHEREQQYSLKCKELKDAIMFDKLGIENVMKQTQEDDLAKKKLKEELKSMESKIESMKSKDEMNRKKIEGLKKSVNKMNDTIKTWETLKNGIDNEFFEIINEVDNLNSKADQARSTSWTRTTGTWRPRRTGCSRSTWTSARRRTTWKPASSRGRRTSS